MLTPLFTELLEATGQTIAMVFISGMIAVIFGVPLGLILYATRQHHLFPHRFFHQAANTVINFIRSTPFIILILAIIPFTRLLVGTAIGTAAALVPLSVAAIAFLGRMVENNLKALPTGLIEAGLAMGASTMQILRKILLPEAMPTIINSITTVLINLISYSATVGAIGGGGLGDLAIHYGYQQFNTMVMIITITLLILLVQFVQYFGSYLSQKMNHH